MKKTNALTESRVIAWVIINDDVKIKEFLLSELLVDEDGLRYWVSDYGTGACHWSVIEKPQDAFLRQMKDNVKWATKRLNWAQDNAKDEVEELQTIIHSNGYSRFTPLLEKLKKFTD